MRSSPNLRAGRPLLQVEDIRAATGGENALLEARDEGYFTVDVPNFWERPEMAGMLRDVRDKPEKYAWIGTGHNIHQDTGVAEYGRYDEIETILADLRRTH
ncbi:hypothetical protein [Novosphingobium aquae]|uniref:Uncharacterized protein n=1 Tax=Novosphingobium aquae TaxID=3133435 RepID=A0ABU8SC13_9SPHN